MRRGAVNAGSGPAAKYVEDYIGGFGEASPTGKPPEMYGCCSANTPMGMYYAWHGITRFDDGIATSLACENVKAWSGTFTPP